MKCPHCEKEIPGSSCPECGEVTPEGASYCMACGSRLPQEVPDASEGDNEFDLENRVLCPDGTCTGIIIQGKCTECGKTPEEAKASDGEVHIEGSGGASDQDG
jgi:hypothetical protein